MSNELNVNEIAYGRLDPGEPVEIYYWNSDYGKHSRRASFFSVAPDPEIPFGGDVSIMVNPGKVDLQITDVWNTVWTNLKNQNTFQWNVRIINIGNQTSAYHLIQAETDN